MDTLRLQNGWVHCFSVSTAINYNGRGHHILILKNCCVPESDYRMAGFQINAMTYSHWPAGIPLKKGKISTRKHVKTGVSTK